MNWFKVNLCIATLSLSLTGPVNAETRELTQSELRSAVASGKMISFKGVIKGVAKMTGGQPVDARAFESGGVYYRVLVKKDTGRIVGIIVDAESGAVVSNKSEVGIQISAIATSVSASITNMGKGVGLGKGSGNGNSGGNSGGNGGGNGGGSGGAGGG